MEGFYLLVALGACLLGNETIAAAIGALTKVACNLYATPWTGSGHRGDLSSTFWTFDDTHLNIYVLTIFYLLFLLREKGGAGPVRDKGAQAFYGRAPLLRL